jgi:hypothetical protein
MIQARDHRLHTFALGLIVIYLATIFSCKSSLSESQQEIEHPITWEKRAIDAVKAQTFVFSDMLLYARKIEYPMLKKTELYRVWVGEGMAPTPVFIVALGQDGVSYVFRQYYRYQQHAQFSEIMESEELNIDEAHAEAFVEVLVLMLGGGSTYIRDIADIRGASHIQKELQEYQSVVTPLTYNVIAHGRCLIAFYVWYHGKIEYWKVEVRMNGVVLKCEVTDVAKFTVPSPH